MTVHELAEALLQGLEVQVPRQLHHRRHVVEGAPGLQLIQEPEPLLRERQRQCPTSRLMLQVQPADFLRVPDVHRQPRGQLLHRGGFEDVAQGQLDPEGLSHAGDQLRGEQRVPAQLEEVSVQADLLGVQHFREDGGELLLCLRARRFEGLRLRSVGVRCRQGLAVHLAVGRQRQRVQHHVGRRHHVLR